MSDQWYYSRDGHEHGPFPYTILQQKAKVGDLLATDQIREATAQEWRVAADFPDLFVTVEAGSGSSEPSSLKGLTMALGIEPAEPGNDPLLGRDIGGVTLVRLIADGGMGRVYEGLQEKPRRPVAVKVIRPGFVSSQLARRFHLEIEVLARLQHPFIAQIYSAGMCDVAGAKVPFFVMEFVPDALSITRYATEKALSTKERLALFRKMCEAVAHGHRNGVIHRDLKPGNILVDRTGTPKVIDFGVARCIDAKPEQMTALTDMGQLIGTLQYMSPEQIAADPTKVDVRTDVYALGVILYELLTGQRPYEISQQQIFEAMRVVQETKPVAPSQLNREVPRDVERIAGKCLYKSHDRRFANAAALVDAIDSYLRGGRIGANEPGWNSTVDDVFEHTDKKATRRQPTAYTAIFIAAALLASGLLSWRTLTTSQKEWRFKRAADPAAFETAEDVEPSEPPAKDNTKPVSLKTQLTAISPNHPFLGTWKHSHPRGDLILTAIRDDRGTLFVQYAKQRYSFRPVVVETTASGEHVELVFAMVPYDDASQYSKYNIRYELDYSDEGWKGKQVESWSSPRDILLERVDGNHELKKSATTN
jgi:serine/threonine protein kinase